MIKNGGYGMNRLTPAQKLVSSLFNSLYIALGKGNLDYAIVHKGGIRLDTPRGCMLK